VVKDFDPIGVGARDLRECLLLQLKAFDPQNTLAQQIVSEHLKQVQANQLKGSGATLNRPIEVVKRALDVIRKLDPRPGLRYNKTEPRLVEPDVYFRKVDGLWQVFLNEDDMPQLRLSPTYRRLLARDAADRDVRNYVKRAVYGGDSAFEEHRAAKAHDSNAFAKASLRDKVSSWITVRMR